MKVVEICMYIKISGHFPKIDKYKSCPERNPLLEYRGQFLCDTAQIRVYYKGNNGQEYTLSRLFLYISGNKNDNTSN